MIQLVGTFAALDEETVTPPSGDSFVSRTIRVLDAAGRTYYCRVSKDFLGRLPEPGEPITLGVWPRPYISKESDKLGCGWTAYRVVSAPLAAAV